MDRRYYLDVGFGHTVLIEEETGLATNLVGSWDARISTLCVIVGSAIVRVDVNGMGLALAQALKERGIRVQGFRREAVDV